jgi:hypothetical protein
MPGQKERKKVPKKERKLFPYVFSSGLSFGESYREYFGAAAGAAALRFV